MNWIQSERSLMWTALMETRRSLQFKGTSSILSVAGLEVFLNCPFWLMAVLFHSIWPSLNFPDRLLSFRTVHFRVVPQTRLQYQSLVRTKNERSVEVYGPMRWKSVHFHLGLNLTMAIVQNGCPRSFPFAFLILLTLMKAPLTAFPLPLLWHVTLPI